MNEVKTLNEIRKIGIDALAKALGPIGTVRFIQSWEVKITLRSGCNGWIRVWMIL